MNPNTINAEATYTFGFSFFSLYLTKMNMPPNTKAKIEETKIIQVIVNILTLPQIAQSAATLKSYLSTSKHLDASLPATIAIFCTANKFKLSVET